MMMLICRIENWVQFTFLKKNYLRLKLWITGVLLPNYMKLQSNMLYVDNWVV